MSASALPRVVVAAPGSSHGKTTVATGLMAALRAEGLAVAPAKVGPDFIDPGWHALAAGRPGRNLDPFLCGEELVEPLLVHGALAHGPADVTVVEGVMGLFDGKVGGDGFASTAHVAALTRSPVLLVVDVSHTSRTAAAVVHGLATFDPEVRVGGVVLNKVGSARHEGEVRRALEATGIEVLGALPRDTGVETPSRHLGLVPAAEREQAAETVARLGERVAAHVDLPRVLRLAHSAPVPRTAAWSPAEALVAAGAAPRAPGLFRPVVAVASGRAFTFEYAETTELLVAAGLEPVRFDPFTATALPAGTAGLLVGGGFPEMHAGDLSANSALRQDIRDAVRSGLPTVAECGGLLYLTRELDGRPMVGAVPATSSMGPRLTLGYRTAVAPADSVLAPAGARVTGHEFHRTTVELDDADGQPAAWLLDGRPDGVALDPAGTGTATLHASYAHTHWAGHPRLAVRFAEAVHAFAGRTGGAW